MLFGRVRDAAAWATITVNSLTDPGAPGICTLRDAITAANTMTATNGCIAGKGNDTIQFSVTGKIKLVDTLPEITDIQLTINGPASPGITISGGGKVQVMQVASGATLNLKNMTIADGSIGESGGAIFNEGMLTVINSTFSGNAAEGGVGGVIVSNFASASFKNNILATSTSRGNCSGTITDLGYNISDDGSCGFSATGSVNNTDPILDPAGPANNGGPTQTIALLSGSPAIDSIPLDSCTDQDGNPLTTDQRRFRRPDAGEAVCDIGAYEFQDFAGGPSTASCYIKGISALSKHYRSLNAAASALGFRSMPALQKAIRAFCKA
jgi:CSLREA domain-containing protein